MKIRARQFISVFLVCVLLVSLLCLSVHAEDNQFSGKLSIAEDYSSASYNGKMYISAEFDLSATDIHRNIPKSSITLTSTQESVISSIEAYTIDAFLYVNIYYKKGGNAFYTYIDSAYLEQYEAFIAEGGSTYIVTSPWSQSIETTLDKLQGEKITMKAYELDYCYVSELSVSTMSEDGYFAAFRGYVFTDGESIYYIDYSQFGADVAYYTDRHLSYHPSSYVTNNFDEATVWKITDKNLIADISAIAGYNQDQSNGGFIDEFDGESDGVATAIAIIFIISVVFIFGLVPLAGLIFAIIMSVKCKGVYKKLYRILAIILAVELLLFITVVLLFIIAAILA